MLAVVEETATTIAVSAPASAPLPDRGKETAKQSSIGMALQIKKEPFVALRTRRGQPERNHAKVAVEAEVATSVETPGTLPVQMPPTKAIAVPAAAAGAIPPMAWAIQPPPAALQQAATAKRSSNGMALRTQQNSFMGERLKQLQPLLVIKLPTFLLTYKNNKL